MIRQLLFFFLLFSSLAGAEPLLPASMAFRPEARALDGQTIEVRFAIAKGYYLYRDKFRFSLAPESVQPGAPHFPDGVEKLDDTFGKVQVYFDEVSIRLPVVRNSSGVLPLELTVTSQGCAEIGVCYPPQKQSLNVELPEQLGAPATSDESGRIVGLLKQADLWLLLVSFFGFGLLLSLTPCVFPMVPIISGIIVGTGRDEHGVSHTRGFLLSLAYVLGMATTYALAGVAAGVTGTLLSSFFQNPWALGGFALVFVALSLSMFGFYELQMPTFLQSKISEEAGHIRSHSALAVALMGALSAIIVGPCVAAPLAGALLYIGQTGDALLGGTALFFMALGMGVPLLAVGLSAGTLLPKSGPWMEAVKKAFGVILLATALWLASPLLSMAVQLGFWALLLIVPSIYMHALDSLPPRASGWHRFWKGIGVVMLITGAACLIGALSGAKDPWRPLAALGGSPRESAHSSLPFERVASLAALEERLKIANKPVMLDFYADWCRTCKEMERDTFSDARVQQKLSGFLLLQADVTANTEADKALLQGFNLYGPPGIVFFDRTGQEIRDVRVVGYQRAEEFLELLGAVKP